MRHELTLMHFIASAKAAARNSIVWGLLWAVGGLVLTAASYASTAAGDRFVVLWGAVAFGLYKVAKGLYYLANPLKLIAKSI